MRKIAESDFAEMCARHNIWCHKWQDVRYCPNCRKPIFITKRTDNMDSQRPNEVQESIVDYLIFTGGIPHWVECKGTNGQTRLRIDDINPKQVNFLNSWIDRGVRCWLFVTLGDGRAPNSRHAYLIDWNAWLDTARACQEWDQISLPWMETGRKGDYYNLYDSFRSYFLDWDKGWVIPSDHPIYKLVEGLPKLYA
jgi:penicillin-binding protein-related factor A (putative recombinase)